MTDLVAAHIEQMAQAVFPLVPSSQHALQALQAAMTNERRQQVCLHIVACPPITQCIEMGVGFVSKDCKWVTQSVSAVSGGIWAHTKLQMYLT